MERIREEIRQETPFRVFNPFNITDQPKGGPIAHTSDHRVQPDTVEFIHKRLHANPVIPKEHHRFFPALMGDIHHLFRQFRNFPSLEILEITELFRRHTVGIIHISLVNDILRTERVSHFPLELL